MSRIIRAFIKNTSPGVGIYSVSFFDFVQYSLIILLIIFGESFSKYHLVGPLHLHDALLAIFVLASFIHLKVTFRFQQLLPVFGISIVYLVISVFKASAPLDIVIRQYAIFGYLICYYLLFNKTAGTTNNQNHIGFLKFIGIISVILQTMQLVYLVLNNINPFGGYYFFSQAVVIGLMLAAAHILAFESWNYKKAIFLLWIFVLAMSTGHTSAFLAILGIIMVYFFLRVNLTSKIVVLIIATGGILLLTILVPQFQDRNAQWRLVAWTYALEIIFFQNYGLVGNGFGVPYFGSEFLFDLYAKFRSTGLFDPSRPMESYLTTTHNSFITMFYTIGFLPSILIFTPFFKISSILILKKFRVSNNLEFLILSVAGATIWVSFNAILELPHSAGLYWLLFFVFWNQLMEETKYYPNVAEVVNEK